MTFSLVARQGDDLGAVVASKFLAAGAFVPDARAGVGAIASQSYVNLRYVPDGFALLERGLAAPEVLERLTREDDQRDLRQVGLVGRQGPGAAYTGAGCTDWAGDASGPDWSAQGNCLAGPAVIADMAAAYDAAQGSLARRLLAGLRAGDAAGGDRRGRQSAALLVVRAGGGYGGGGDVLVDLRVDDAAPTGLAPVPELERLLGLHELYFDKAAPEDLLPLTGEAGQALAGEVRDRLARLGRTGDDLDTVLFDWMGWENYEERHVPGAIDPVVLRELRASTERAS